MQDPLKSIVENAVPTVSKALLENSVFELPKPGQSSVIKELTKEIQSLEKADTKTKGWDKFVKDTTDKGLRGRLSFYMEGRIASTPDERKMKAPIRLDAALEEYNNKYPDGVSFSAKSMKDLKGIIFKHYPEEEHETLDNFFEDEMHDNPYFAPFTKKARNQTLAKQRLDKDKMGKFKFSPLPTRESVKRALYQTEKVENINEYDPSYMEMLDGKLDEHFSYGMTHDMLKNWWTETDRFTKMFPPDPEFNLSEHYDEYQQWTQEYPSPDFADRLTKAKSYAELKAIVNASKEVGIYREQAGAYFGESMAGRGAEMGLDMLHGIGLDPVGLAAGMFTGGAGAAAAGKLIGGQTIKAMAGRALIEGGLGGIEGMGYMHIYGKHSDPQRNEADLKQGFIVGGGLGTAFELLLGGTARGVVGKGLDKAIDAIPAPTVQTPKPFKDIVEVEQKVREIIPTKVVQDWEAIGDFTAKEFQEEPEVLVSIDDLPPKVKEIAEWAKPGILVEKDIEALAAIIPDVEEGEFDVRRILTETKKDLFDRGEKQPFSERVPDREYQQYISDLEVDADLEFRPEDKGGFYTKLVDSIHEYRNNPDSSDAFLNIISIILRGSERLQYGFIQNLPKLRKEGSLKGFGPLDLIEFFADNNVEIRMSETGNFDIQTSLLEEPLLNVEKLRLTTTEVLRRKVHEVKKATSRTFVDSFYDPEAFRNLEVSRELFDFLGAIIDEPEASPIIMQALRFLDEDATLEPKSAVEKAREHFKELRRYKWEDNTAILPRAFDDPESLLTLYYAFLDDPELRGLEIFNQELWGPQMMDDRKIERSLYLFSSIIRLLEAKIQNDPNYISKEVREKLEKINRTLSRTVDHNIDKAQKFINDHPELLEKIFENSPVDLEIIREYFGDLDMGYIREMVHGEVFPDKINRFNPGITQGSPLILTPTQAAIDALQKFHKWRNKTPLYKEAQIALRKYLENRHKQRFYTNLLAEGRKLLKAFQRVNWSRATTADHGRIIERRAYKILDILTAIRNATGFDLENPRHIKLIEDLIKEHAEYARVAKEKHDKILKKAKRRKGIDPDKAGFIDLELFLGPAEKLAKGIKKIFDKFKKEELVKTEAQAKKERILKSALAAIARDLQDGSIHDQDFHDYAQILAESLYEAYDIPEKDTYKMLRRLWDNRGSGKGKSPIMWTGTNPLDDIFNPLLDRHSLFSMDGLKRQLFLIDEFLIDFYDNHPDIDENLSEGYFEFDYIEASEAEIVARITKAVNQLKEIEKIDIAKKLADEGTPDLDRLYNALAIEVDDTTRYNIYKFYAALASYSGNILAPTSIVQTISDNILGHLNYIPQSLILDLMGDYNERDFRKFFQHYTNNHMPFIHDTIWQGKTSEASLTFGKLLTYFDREGTLKDWLDDNSLLVVAPHRSVVIELEKISQRLADLVEERGTELTEKELIQELGPIGPTGLPRDLERVLLPSSKQEAWKRWTASTREIIQNILLVKPNKEDVRNFKRAIKNYQFYEENGQHLGLSDDTRAILQINREKLQRELEKAEAIEPLPQNIEIFENLNNILENFDEFFDDTVEKWSMETEKDKTFMEFYIQEISYALGETLKAVEIARDNGLTNKSIEGAPTNIRKAINQLHLLAGLEEPHPEFSVDYQRLTFIESMPLTGDAPAIFSKALDYKFIELEQFIKDKYGSTVPDFSFFQLKDFVDEIKAGTKGMSPEIDKLRALDNADLSLFFEGMEGSIDKLEAKLNEMLGSDEYRYLNKDEDMKRIILETFQEYKENALALRDKMQSEGWGKKKYKLEFSRKELEAQLEIKKQDPDFTKARASKLQVERGLKRATKPEDLLRIYKRGRLLPYIPDVVKVIRKAIELGVDNLQDLDDFYGTLTAQASQEYRKFFNQLNKLLFEDTWSMEGLESKLDALLRDEDGGPPTAMYGGIPYFDLTPLVEKAARGMKSIMDKLVAFLQKIGSELSIYSRGAAQSQFDGAKKKARSLEQWLLSYGSEMLNLAGGMKVPTMLNKLRSARARAGASDVGAIRRLGQLIFGSELYDAVKGKVKQRGQAIRELLLQSGALKMKSRILGQFKRVLLDLENEQKLLQKLFNTDREGINKIILQVYEATNLMRQSVALWQKKVEDGVVLPSLAEIFSKLGEQENMDRLLIDLFESQEMPVPEILLSAKKDDVRKLINYILKLDSERRKIVRHLSPEHPIRKMVESSINPNILSNDTLLDFDMILEFGEFERMLDNSLSILTAEGKGVKKPISQLLAYIFAAAIRDGKLNILTQENIFDAFKGLSRYQLYKLANKYLIVNNLADIFPVFAGPEFAGFTKENMVKYLVDNLFEEVNRKSLFDNLANRLYRTLDKFLDIDNTFKDIFQGESDYYGVESPRALRKMYDNAKAKLAGERTPLEARLVDQIDAYLLDQLEQLRSKKGMQVKFSKNQQRKFRLTVEPEIEDWTSIDDFIDMLRDDLDDIIDTEYKNLPDAQLQVLATMIDVERARKDGKNDPKIRVTLDTKAESNPKIKKGISEREEYKRVKERTQVGKKIVEDTAEGVTIEDLVSTADLDDLEHTGNKAVDALVEEQLLNQINRDIEVGLDPSVKERNFKFETLDEFFDFLEEQFRNLSKEGIVTNGPEYMKMLTLFRELTTGRGSKSHPRYLNDFIKLMQKGASAMSTAGFGIAALPEAIIALARNVPRLVSKIPFLSQVIDGSQKIENFEPQIKKAEAELRKLRKKLDNALDFERPEIIKEIDQQLRHIHDLEKKHELTLDIIYGAGVGTEGALYRNTGSNRRSAIFDDKNPLISAAHRPDEFGIPSTGQKIYGAAEKYLEGVSERAAEGSLLPVLPTGERLMKPLSLNFLTEWTQKVVFNSFVTKFIRKVERLQLPFEVEDATSFKRLTNEELSKIIDPIIPKTLRAQLHISPRALLRIIIGMKLALRETPPRKKHGFTHYDIGSILNHPAIGENHRQNLVAGIYNWIGQNVARPDAGDLPLYMSSGFLSLLAQFRAFGAGQFQKVTMPLIQRTFEKGNTGKQRIEAAGALAATASMSALFAALQYAMYNSEEVKEDMESQGGLKQVAKTGIGDLAKGNFSEDSRNTLTPFSKIIVGGIMAPFTGGVGFGADVAYAAMGVEDPLSWYEGGGRAGKNQVAVDMANSMAAYRFFANTFIDPIKLGKGAMDAQTRADMVEEYKYDAGNTLEKTSAAVEAAGIKEKDQIKYLERLSGNYKLFKMIEMMTNLAGD